MGRRRGGLRAPSSLPSVCPRTVWPGPGAVTREQQSTCWWPRSPLCPCGPRWSMCGVRGLVPLHGTSSPWRVTPSPGLLAASPCCSCQPFSLSGWSHSVWTLVLPSTALSLPSRPFYRVTGMSFGQQPCLLKQSCIGIEKELLSSGSLPRGPRGPKPGARNLTQLLEPPPAASQGVMQKDGISSRSRT